MRPSVAVVTGPDGEEAVEFSNHEWLLRIGMGEAVNPGQLLNLAEGVTVADEDYLYRFSIRGAPSRPDGSSDWVACQGIRPLQWSSSTDGDSTEVVVNGRCDFKVGAPSKVDIEHTFRLYGDNDRLEERLSLTNVGDQPVELSSDLHFAFRKTLVSREGSIWRDSADERRLVPVPLRRRVGLMRDHRLPEYNASDLMPVWPSMPHLNLPGRSAEAWLWGDSSGGFLTAKYALQHIEFALATTMLVPPKVPTGRTTQHWTLPAEQDVCLCFAGAAVCKGEPAGALRLDPGERFDFGVSVICRYVGEWQAGYASYKKILNEHGHGLRPDYSAQVHWNELYSLGWPAVGAPPQELPQLWEEAALAQAAGAEALYFDPGWDTYLGSCIWDAERLGQVSDFVTKLRDEYGLTLALHLMMHTQATTDDPAIYRRTRDGEVDLMQLAPGQVAGGAICAGSKAWQKQKIERVSALAKIGVGFFMLDFLHYGSPNEGAELWEESGACWSSEHGHRVPITRKEHAEGILHVIRQVKRRYPHVVIEAHDRITGGVNDYLPLYYQHGPVDSFDEIWGFEFMWDSFADLLSGKALSLYEYNLAYDIPMYLHINVAHDAPSMVTFWWYASTCRHLGVGGLTPDKPLWKPFRAAMERYRQLKPYFVSGRFVGIDQYTHGHALDDGSAVLVAFNLTSSSRKRTVTVPADVLGVSSIRAAVGGEVELTGEAVSVTVEVPAMSAVVVEINARHEPLPDTMGRE